MLGHSPSNVTHEYILSSYHHVSLHLLIKLLRHASSFTILYKYRIKFLKNPRNWKLDGQGGGRHGARGPRWRHNLIWPRSSLRISRKQAEREREREISALLRGHTHTHAHAYLSVQFFLSPLSASPLPHYPSLSLSLSSLPFLSPAHHTIRPLESSALQSGAATCTTWWIPSREPDGGDHGPGTVSIFCHPGALDRFHRADL